MQEKWRPVVGWEPWYEVSNLGRVRTITKRNRYVAGLILQAYVDAGGYHIIWLNGGGKRRAFRLHRVVAEAFIGQRPEELEVNHIDGDKSNDRAHNLEYVTASENIQHSMRLGLRVPPRAKRKVTEEQVRQIRALKGTVYLRVAADRFSISISQVSNIWNGVSWKDVA